MITLVFCALGSVPSSIALHNRLEALDIRNNALTGIPPEWSSADAPLVAKAPLVYLRMADNQFDVSSDHVSGSFSVPLAIAKVLLL